MKRNRGSVRSCLQMLLAVALLSGTAVRGVEENKRTFQEEHNYGGNLERREEATSDDVLLCQVEILQVNYGELVPDEMPEELVRCRVVDNGGQSFQMDAVLSLLTSDDYERLFELPTLGIHGGYVQGHSILIDDKAKLHLDWYPGEGRHYYLPPPSEQHSRRRQQELSNLRRQSFVGDRRLLVVHVNSMIPEDPGLTLQELDTYVFGRTNAYKAPASLVSQYSNCSHGQLNFQFAGLHSITLPDYQTVAGGDILGDLQWEIVQETHKTLGVEDLEDIADHVIFCLPNESHMDGEFHWTAFTYFRGMIAFFQRRRCSSLSVLVHEIGHQFGFRHSQGGRDEYGDESGYMGYTEFRIGHPLRCFNAHKHWMAGWYTQQQISLDPYVEIMDRPRLIPLKAFVDYPHAVEFNGKKDVCLIKIDQFYLQYNRAKGMNIDTAMYQDTVTITQGPDYMDAISVAFAAMEAGDQPIVIFRYPETGNYLMVQVCELTTFETTDGGASTNSAVSGLRAGPSFQKVTVDIAWVSIWIDGEQSSRCDEIPKVDSNIPEVSQPEDTVSDTTVLRKKPVVYTVRDENRLIKT